MPEAGNGHPHKGYRRYGYGAHRWQKLQKGGTVSLIPPYPAFWSLQLVLCLFHLSLKFDHMLVHLLDSRVHDLPDVEPTTPVCFQHFDEIWKNWHRRHSVARLRVTQGTHDVKSADSSGEKIQFATAEHSTIWVFSSLSTSTTSICQRKPTGTWFSWLCSHQNLWGSTSLRGAPSHYSSTWQLKPQLAIGQVCQRSIEFSTGFLPVGGSSTAHNMPSASRSEHPESPPDLSIHCGTYRAAERTCPKGVHSGI